MDRKKAAQSNGSIKGYLVRPAGASAAAKLAWQRTLTWFDAYLRG
jgi:dienelactone hydrolase